MASLNTLQRQNISKTWFLLGIFFGFILLVGYALSIVLNAPGIMFAAGVFSMFSSVGSYWFSDKIALSMTRAKPVTRATHSEIYAMVDALAITAGIPTPKVYIIDDPALNAFATGRNPKNSVVAFTQGIVDTLEPKELRGVAAHELAHIVNRDMLIGTIAVILASAVAMVGRMMHMGVGSSMQGDNRGGNPVKIFIVIGLLVIAPLLASLLRFAVSRKREFLADATGAKIAGDTEGLARALERIGGDGRALRHKSEMTAHLFISNPFKSTKFSKFFMTHPPMEERIMALRGAAEHGMGSGQAMRH